ncbi:MAG: HAD family hydrolase [Erysipelotrichaceae bacterium]|nr:HAD family hydrolase [Erysipelotrichaceae bacterium]
MKAIIFDIDGTLYDEHKRIYTLSSVLAIKKLREKGIIVIIATGRPPQAMTQLLANNIECDYLIAGNGHIVRNSQGQDIIKNTFPIELCDDIKYYCQKHNEGLLFKFPEFTYIYYDCDAFSVVYERNKEALNKTILFDRQDIHLSVQAIGGCIGSTLAQLKCFNDHFNNRCVATNIDGKYSDIGLYNVTKKSALVDLLELLKINPIDCMSFGDNFNDIEINQYVGIGIAMGNSVSELKAKSDYTADNIDEDGIMKSLIKYHIID